MGWVAQSRAGLAVTPEAVTRLVRLSAMPAEPAGMAWGPAVVSGGLRGDRPVRCSPSPTGTSGESPMVLVQAGVGATAGWEAGAVLLSHAEDFSTRWWAGGARTGSRWPACLPPGPASRLPQVGTLTWVADTLGPLPAPLSGGPGPAAAPGSRDRPAPLRPTSWPGWVR